MKKLLIVAPFCTLPGEPGFNRFLYLAEILSEHYSVTLLTSTYSYKKREHRSFQVVENLGKERFKIELIDEPGYKGSVSFSRLYSHYIFCKNFEKWLIENCGYDLIYSAYPLIETNRIIERIRRLYGLKYKLIVDIQDVWPESISSVMPFVSSLDPMKIPFSRKANKVYKSADALVAVSGKYLSRARSVAKSSLGEVVYIGSDFEKIESCQPVVFKESKVRLVYFGSMSYSYDLVTVVKGFKDISADVELHLFGGGGAEDKLKKMAADNVFFHGYRSFEEIMSFAKSCSAAINPIKAHAPQTITNKISDYLSLGIPVINSQEGEEVEEVLRNVLHVNFKSGDVNSFTNAVDEMIRELKRSRDWAPCELFDRKAQYEKIHNLLKAVADE